MLNRTLCVVAILCGCAAAVLWMTPSSQAGIFDCLFGCCHRCAAPVAVAPACGTCATQTCGYMPSVVYRAMYQPAVVPVYQPVAGCSTCSGYTSYYAATTYRPAYPWTYQARLVPYATYQPVYTAMPVVAYSPCTTCGTCSSCGSCSTGGCNTCATSSPCESCSSCGSGSCGAATYVTPTATPSCPSCAASTTVSPAPYSGSSEAAPRTFQSERPATGGPELKPTPQPDAKYNSMPVPLLPDPQDRTASRSMGASAQVRLVASPVQASPAHDSDGWQAARN